MIASKYPDQKLMWQAGYEEMKRRSKMNMDDYRVDFTRKEYHCGSVVVLAENAEDAIKRAKEHNLTESEAADRDFFAHEDEIESAELLDR